MTSQEVKSEGAELTAVVLPQNVSPEVSSDFRHVVYTCFQPREFATAEDLDLKRIAYEQYRVTTHWPAYNVALFPEGGSGVQAQHSSGQKAQCFLPSAAAGLSQA